MLTATRWRLLSRLCCLPGSGGYDSTTTSALPTETLTGSKGNETFSSGYSGIVLEMEGASCAGETGTDSAGVTRMCWVRVTGDFFSVAALNAGLSPLVVTVFSTLYTLMMNDEDLVANEFHDFVVTAVGRLEELPDGVDLFEDMRTEAQVLSLN